VKALFIILFIDFEIFIPSTSVFNPHYASLKKRAIAERPILIGFENNKNDRT